MPLIDYSFAVSGTVLRLECAIANGWGRARQTYCFSEEIRVPWKLDYTLKTRASVFP